MSSRLRIVVTGLIAQHPRLGGLTWHYLQYLLGLTRLGHDVYYLEDSGQWPYTADGGTSGNDWIAYDCTDNVQYLTRVMDRFGLGDRWAYRFPIRPRWFGMPHWKRRDIVQTADLLLNVSGSLKRPTDYRSIRRLAYIDSDPVFTQIKLVLKRGQLKFRKRVNAHDIHFTFGERLANDADGYHWLPTRQPVELSQWRTERHPRRVFTTVMNWTSYAPLLHRGHTYGQKDAEFLRFLNLPAQAPSETFEVALNGIAHSRWATANVADMPEVVRELIRTKPDCLPNELLTSAGWTVVDAATACRDLDGYRDYVQSSLAEWSVAKHGYVAGQPGWFSDRSACFLAAGRPVILQHTGFDSVLPVGEGLFAFDTMEQAIDAIRTVSSDPIRHSKAAHDLAHAYFDSATVLTSLVARATSTIPATGATPPSDTPAR